MTVVYTMKQTNKFIGYCNACNDFIVCDRSLRKFLKNPCTEKYKESKLVKNYKYFLYKSIPWV